MLKHPHGIPLFRPSVRRTLEMQAHRGYEPHPTFVHLMETVGAHCDVVTLFPQVYTPEELGRIEAPTLLLVGGEEKLYAPRKAIARAELLIPDLTTLLVPGAGHTLNMERPEMVNPAIIEFLTRLDLPEWSYSEPEVTVRRLLSHTTGMPLGPVGPRSSAAQSRSEPGSRHPLPGAG
jgi:hypothetical protein